MKILDRYVLATFLKNYLISLMVLIGMYIVLDMVLNFHDLMDIRGENAANADAEWYDTIYRIGDYYFYRAFLIFVYLSGIVPVVAAAFTLMRLSRFNELTAVLAAGVPMLRVALPVVIGGIVLNGLLIADQELFIPQVIPQLMREPDQTISGAVKTFPIMALQDKNKALLRATRYTPASADAPPTMDIVDIIERKEVERNVQVDGKEVTRRVIVPVAHTSADHATWNEGEQRWDLVNGRRTNGLGTSEDGGISTTATASYYKSNVTPEEVALYRSGDWVELLSTSRINELIERPGNYGQAHLLRVKHWRFTQPIMNIILLLLAIPCVLTREPGKLKAAATKCLILTGLAMGGIFLSHQLAGRSPRADWAHVWPAFTAWLPIFVFGPSAVLLLQRVKS